MEHDFVFPQPLEEITAKPSTVAAKFIERGVVAFRSEDEDRSGVGNDIIVALGCAIGDIAAFTPSADRPSRDHPSKESWRYHQVHDTQIGYLIEGGNNTPDQCVIQWHVEGPSLKTPQLAAIWHMYHFIAKPGTGNTGFVDMQMLYQKLPENYRDLLDRADLMHLPNWQNPPQSEEEFVSQFKRKFDAGLDVIWTQDGDRFVSSFSRKAVEVNPNTGMKTLRACPCCAGWGPQDFLFKVDGRKPTDDETALWDEFFDWLKWQIEENPENQIWWEWKQGDIVLPDLFRMAHGVHAGFLPGERAFWGYWCHDFGTGKEPVEEISRESYEMYLLQVP